MKHVSYFILAFLFMAMFTACEDFLEEEVYSNLAPSNFYQTEADAVAAVSAVYNCFQVYGNEWWNVGNAWMSMTDGVTDVMYLFWWGSFENFTYNSSDGSILQLWQWVYNTNNKANIVMNRLPGISMDDALRSRLIAETKFLRALNYFDMVRLWGDVPVILNEIEGFDDIEQVSRTPAAQVYDQIILDLTDAIAGLPVSYENANDAGRATQGAAKALLGKVYLARGWGGGPGNINTSDLQMAVDEFEDLMAAPYNYALASNVTDVFDYTQENSPELGHIFSVQYSTGLGYEGSWLAQNMQAMELESAWWGFAAPESWAQGPDGYACTWEQSGLPDDSTWYFVPLDERLNELYEDYNNMMWFHWCKKWQYEHYLGWAEHPQNLTLIRWADILLSHSEALNELSAAPDASVVASINLVRERAGVDPYDPPEWTKETFRDEIQDERNRELWGEGHAWFDYVRKGMLVDRMTAAGIDPSLVTDKNNLYPIPQQEIENNPNLAPQNPGW